MAKKKKKKEIILKKDELARLKKKDIEVLQSSMIKGKDEIIKIKGSAEGIHTTNKPSFELTLEEFANGIYKQKYEEGINNFLRHKKYHEDIKKAGLWAFYERKKRILELKKKIKKETGQKINNFEDLENKIKYLEKNIERYPNTEYFLDDFDLWKPYLKEWKKKDKIEWFNPITKEVEGDNIILENAKKILKEKSKDNQILTRKYERAWKGVLDAARLLEKTGQDEFCDIIIAYDGSNLSLSGIENLVDVYKKHVKKLDEETPAWIKSDSRKYKTRMKLFDQILHYLIKIKDIREKEFPLCRDLMEIVESYELSKIDPEKAKHALQAMRDARKLFERDSKHPIDIGAYILTEDGKLVYGEHIVGKNLMDVDTGMGYALIDPEIAKAVLRVYKSGTDSKIPKNKAHALGF